MTNSVTPKSVASFTELENTAKAAAEQLGKANSHNAIWDKATKSLKPLQTDLPKALTDAENENKVADALWQKLADSYDSEASSFVRTIRTAIDAKITELAEKTSAAEQALNEAKTKVALAKTDLDESNVKFEAAQKQLIALPKEIQDRLKQLIALETEAKDAHSKHQLVEAVVKLADLKDAHDNLKNVTNTDYAKKLWQDLSMAAADLIQKTDALALAQGEVPKKENDFNTAKTNRDVAQKARLDDIREKVADKESAPELPPAKQSKPQPSLTEKTAADNPSRAG